MKTDKNKKIKIGFLGYLFKPPKVPGKKIVAAFREIRSKGFNVELNIYGDKTLTARKTVEDENDRTIVLHKRTSHKKSLMKISNCDFLLLALSDLPTLYELKNQGKYSPVTALCKARYSASWMAMPGG